MLSLYLNLIDDAGQRIEFETLYFRYRKQMLLLAKSLLHNDADAEDVVHDVFCRIAARHMNFIQSLWDPDDVRNYLLKATKNTALNELKRKGRGVIPLELVNEWEDGEDLPDDAFLDLICDRAEYDRVLHAMLKLDEPYRDILYYHFVLELSVPEAAKRLGRKPATAKKQLVRGKKLLLKALDAEGK